jgi:hypothetical protein
MNSVSRAFDIGITWESTVFISGMYSNGGNSNACYWSNNVLHPLNDGATLPSTANRMHVCGSSIIIAGCYNNSGNQQACYWENGSLTTLSDGALPSSATAVSIDDDVAVSGYYNGSGYPVMCYWLNGTKHDVPYPSQSKAYDISTHSYYNHLFLVGYENSTPVACNYILGDDTTGMWPLTVHEKSSYFQQCEPIFCRLTSNSNLLYRWNFC